MLHNYLTIETVNQLLSKLKKIHFELQTHKSPLISLLSSKTLPGYPKHYLKRHWYKINKEKIKLIIK